MAIYTGRAMIDGGNEPGDPTPVSSTTNTITPVVAPIATATPDVVTPTTTPNPQLGTPHVPYAQLTAAQRAAMTPEEQLAYIHSDTVARQAAATIQRMSDPMTDPTNRPSAPPFKDGFIYYYVVLVCLIWLTYDSIFFYLRLVTKIDPGMALTPFPSSNGRDSNPRLFDRESSSLPTRPDFRRSIFFFE